MDGVVMGGADGDNPTQAVAAVRSGGDVQSPSGHGKDGNGRADAREVHSPDDTEAPEATNTLMRNDPDRESLDAQLRVLWRAAAVLRNMRRKRNGENVQ
jgi:hypothetical protein